jgi:hypothetical protein
VDSVIDRLRAEMDDLIQSPEFAEVIEVTVPTKYDDPALVVVNEYPYLFVAPQVDQPVSETAGRAGYSVRALNVNIGLVINVADYFDPTVSENPGSKPLVQAVGLIQKRLLRLSKRRLDSMPGVRNVVIGATQYVPDVRNGTFVRMAVITLVVEKQYQHEE